MPKMLLLAKMTVIFSPLAAAETVSPVPDGDQVAVALVGVDDLVGVDGLDAGGHRRSPAMEGVDAVGVAVIIEEAGAAHRSHHDGLFQQPHFLQDLAHDLVGDAVAAAGAVVTLYVVEIGAFLIDHRHVSAPPRSAGRSPGKYPWPPASCRPDGSKDTTVWCR